MPTRNVVITDEQQETIDALVASGRYQNASEVLRAGLRMVEEHETLYAEKLRLLRSAAKAGFDEVDAGRYVEITDKADEDAFWAGVDAEAQGRIAEREA